jgi:type IV pilus assembly protein PilF
MFTIDERLKGLPALKEQVVALYESLNQPHLAIPGRAAGLAKAYILGLRGPSGFAAFVYLYLPHSAECAVYMPSNRSATAEQYPNEEVEALGFVESMGFMMDNLNFRARTPAEQDQLVKTLPPFQRAPPGIPKGTPHGAKNPLQQQGGSSEAPSNAALGKLLGSFCLLALAALGCKHVPTPKEQLEATNFYDLAANNLTKDPRQALMDVERALELNPDLPEANNAKGVLLHLAFSRPEEAVRYYKHALEVRPAFSECKVNLGNVYLDQKRYDEAIALYKDALNDMLYVTPFLAQGNMGWALYKKGQRDEALSSIKAAVTLNPKFCLGYRNLGTIYDEGGQTDEACKAFSKFRELCPDTAEAYQREGVCLAKKGDLAGAHKSLKTCIEKSRVDAEREDCQKLKEGLGPPPPPSAPPEAGGK